MVKTTLVEHDIEDGGRLIQALDKNGFVVQSAFWYLLPDETEWRLLIASPVVERDGPKKAYQRIQSALGRMDPSAALELQNISVVSTKDPLVRLLGRALRTGPGISGIRFSRNTIDGTFVEDAYIYRLQAA